MSVVNCQVDLQGRAPDQQLTVGDKFLLSCDGDLSTPLKDTAQFQFAEEDKKYTLHVLKVQESTPHNFKLIVTSYKPGEYKAQKLKITDGVTTVDTSDVSWQVNSILDPSQESKPFPSEGPFLISYPLWFWLTLMAIVVMISSLFGLFVYRKKRRHKLKAHLDSFSTMLPPFSQFSRDMRVVRRKIEMMKDEEQAAEMIKKIDEDFRLYLIRELKVPALQLSDRELLAEIKREHPYLYKIHKADLLRILSEMTNAKSDLNRVKVKDCVDLSFLSRQIAEKIHAVKRKAKDS